MREWLEKFWLVFNGWLLISEVIPFLLLSRCELSSMINNFWEANEIFASKSVSNWLQSPGFFSSGIFLTLLLMTLVLTYRHVNMEHKVLIVFLLVKLTQLRKSTSTDLAITLISIENFLILYISVSMNSFIFFNVDPCKQSNVWEISG